MQQLAQQTGGRFFEVSKHDSIDDIYKTIGEELRNQYNIIVQTREGYYSAR